MKFRNFGGIKLFNYKPTIIAEAGVNHGCNIKLALKYIKYAKEGFADAIKFQTYKAEKLVSKNSPAYWDTNEEKTKSQYELFKKFDKFKYNDYLTLYRQCKKKNILFMSTLFDTDAVDKYNKFIKIYKVSSSDINNIPLLRKVGSKNKHTILSTGAASIKEIKRAIKYLNLQKNKICIMHCVLNYPANDSDLNLNFIKTLKKNFPGYMIGYSDHSKSDSELNVIEKAYDLGAIIIEKHFTHNKRLRGNDHYHSMDKKELISFNKKMERKKIITGSILKKLTREKKSILFARRSIFAKKNIKKGEIFSNKNLITLRPGTGISADKWDYLLGKKSLKTIKKNQPINHKDFI